MVDLILAVCYRSCSLEKSLHRMKESFLKAEAMEERLAPRRMSKVL